MKFLESAEGSSVNRLVSGGKQALRGTLVAARFVLPSFDIHSPSTVPLEHMAPPGITIPFDGFPLGDSSDDFGHHEKSHLGAVRPIKGRRPHDHGGGRTAVPRVVFTPEHKHGHPRSWLVFPGSDDRASYGTWRGGGDERNEKNTARSFSEPARHAKTIARGLASFEKDDWGKNMPSGLAGLKHDLRGFDDLSPDGQRQTVNKLTRALPPFPPAPEGWQPVASSTEEKEKLDWALMVLAEAGLLGGAIGLAYQLGKNRRKAIPVLVAVASLVTACGGNIAETATAIFPGGQQTTEQAPSPALTILSPTAPLSSPNLEASATTGFSGSGGGFQTCEAAAETFLAPRISQDGARVPSESMVQHSPDPNKWTVDEKRALVDSSGNSIAPLIDDLKDQIAEIDSNVSVVAVWSSSEGYVLQLQVNGKDVWAVARNGLLQYRPDQLVDTILGDSEGDTDEFRILPDPPVEGEKRYVVTGGCGVLGVFDKKGNMVAMYKPLTNEWVMLTGDNAAQAFGTPATPLEQLASATPLPPEPSPTLEEAPATSAEKNGYSILAQTEMQEVGLMGDGIRVQTEYEGLPVDVVIVASPSIQRYFDGHAGYGLNSKLIDNEITGSQRLAQAVLLGHYRGYLEDAGKTSDKYMFEQFVADLKAGKDRSYYIWGNADKDIEISGRQKVNPLAKTEIVFTNEIISDNGNASIYVTQDFRIGYYVDNNRGLRLVILPGASNISQYPERIGFYSSNSISAALWTLGWPEKTQQYGPKYNISSEFNDPVRKEMDATVCPVVDTKKGYCDFGDQLLVLR